MANYTYTQNGITFDNVKAPAISTGGITVCNENQKSPIVCEKENDIRKGWRSKIKNIKRRTI